MITKKKKIFTLQTVLAQFVTKKESHSCMLFGRVRRKLCVDSWYREGIKMSLEPSDYSAARNGEEETWGTAYFIWLQWNRLIFVDVLDNPYFVAK